MDFFDIPTSCPVVEGQPLRYSVGVYQGRNRLVVAWFFDYKDAYDYLKRARIEYPRFVYDILRTLF